jgi:hypothetical protein
MPRIIDKHQRRQILAVDSRRVSDLADWLTVEVEDALSSRKHLEAEWREGMRIYNGVPRSKIREVPVENAPNVEVTIGAIACDDIYAQAMDLIFSASPLVTCRPKPKGRDDDETVSKSKALQRLVNHIASTEAMVYPAVQHSLLDDVQLGTGVFYIPFVERLKKTKVASIKASHPIIRAVPPEDWIIFENNKSLQETIGTGLRFYRGEGELADIARKNRWNLEGVTPIGHTDWVRSRRYAVGRQYESFERRGKLYTIWDMYVLFDIDNDGIDEELYVAWNHEGRAVCYVGFAPTDWRPIETYVYQPRPHLPYGLGVLEMLRPYEHEITEIHNYQLLNALLANARVWRGRGVADTLKIWPGKVINLESEADELEPLVMADVYPSLWQFQMMIQQLANRRVGVNELNAPQNMPNRTPGITAISMLQQVNRRFSPAFGDMRRAIADALKQCLYRYQERLLAGRNGVADHIYAILGANDGKLAIELLRDESFDEQIDVELTASSASVNREADRQNAVMLINTLGQYYQNMIQLTMLAANPQTPPEVREVAKKVSMASSELIDRTLRTFDQIRDPDSFTVDIEDQITSAAAGAPELAMQQLISQLSGTGEQSQSSPLALPERTMV